MSTLLWVRSYGYLDKIMSCHRQNLIGEDFLGPRFVSVPPEKMHICTDSKTWFD